MKITEETYKANDEIDISEFFGILYSGKWVIITLVILFSVASVFYAINKPNVYKSEALLSPASGQKNGGLSALAGQFGGLASLAGLNLNSGESDKVQLALEVLASRQFISQFIQKRNILPELMAAESWDLENNNLRYDSSLFDTNNKEWVREVSPPFKPEPSQQEAYKKFKDILSISKDSESGMVTISIEFLSPVLAQQWVTWLVQDINHVMKSMDVQEATKSTEFLSKQLQETKVADIRTVLFTLIEEQAKTIMFANVRDEYVFKTIDPALVPEEKSGPKRALICIVGAFLGAMFGTFFVVVRHFKSGIIKR